MRSSQPLLTLAAECVPEAAPSQEVHASVRWAGSWKHVVAKLDCIPDADASLAKACVWCAYVSADVHAMVLAVERPSLPPLPLQPCMHLTSHISHLRINLSSLTRCFAAS